MACTDQLAFWLLDACRRAGVAVPEEVAVVGVENDETLCTLASPQLSSVAFEGEQMGYEAAALLDRMMAGEAKPSEPILVAPKGLVVRQSSDIMAIDDPQVAAAVRYIREHACHGINVADVVKHAGISRTLLERRMRPGHRADARGGDHPAAVQPREAAAGGDRPVAGRDRQPLRLRAPAIHG